MNTEDLNKSIGCLEQVRDWLNVSYVTLEEGREYDMAAADSIDKVLAALRETQAAVPQWVPVADLPGALEHEFLYVLLPDKQVTQALYTDFFTDDLDGQAWGHYTDVDCIEPLPVQPTHYFTPPVAPAGTPARG